jgi:hypothetical protein
VKGKQLKMKKLLLVGFALFVLISPATAEAADIQWSISAEGTRTPMIVINGDIVSGDYLKFKKLANQVPWTVVVMTSRGGVLVDGLNIGNMIRAKGFSTFVHEYCMSVCAMMWLAGVKRSAISEASIGFHGASYENGEPSIAGNALVGAYLANLGYSYKAIAALINVGAKEMNWLSDKWAKELGIEVIIPAGPCYDARTWKPNDARTWKPVPCRDR